MIHKDIVTISKPQGLTPLQAVKLFQKKFPKYKSSKIGYAGRLDPMAEGLLLLLLDEENKKKLYYENLVKTYEAIILLGIGTDTFDLLGKIIQFKPISNLNLDKKLSKSINKFIGTYKQSYPPYSSVRVQGKPLFYWAREDKINSITIPSKQITIDAISINKLYYINGIQLLSYAKCNIENVSGAFRQAEILVGWKNFLNKHKTTSFPLVNISVSCTSGTYIRSLANELGKSLRSNGLAYKIKRVKIGDFILSDATNIVET